MALATLPPAVAQGQPSLAADTCVATQEDGNGGYRLSNVCDYAIEIAYCSQPKTDAGLCLRGAGWDRERLSARGQEGAAAA